MAGTCLRIFYTSTVVRACMRQRPRGAPSRRRDRLFKRLPHGAYMSCTSRSDRSTSTVPIPLEYQGDRGATSG